MKCHKILRDETGGTILSHVSFDLGTKEIETEPACIEETNPTFTTWQDFGDLWEWAKKQEWWREFYFSKLCIPCGWHVGIMEFSHAMIDPLRFPDLICDFGSERLGWRE
jgi:hypothetical protein